jgi:phosphate transport system substrate-binding protein
MNSCHEPTVSRRRFLQLAGIGLLAGSALPQALAQDAFGQALLKGAGSTFVMPLVERWLIQYRAGQFDAGSFSGGSGLDGDLLGRAALDYEAIGSQAGLLRLQAKAVDFAFSELPLSSHALAQHGLIQLPIVSGGVAIVAHIPGLKSALRLDGQTLAAIFRSHVQRWNDPAVALLNPGIALPNELIAPLHRAEGSGSTYTLSRYLAGHDAQWLDVVGVDAVVKWPVGGSVRGSAGMAQALASTPFSIGYLDAVQAESTGLGIVQMKNIAGFFVTPSAQSIEAATQSVPWRMSRETQPQFIDAAGELSYPVVATVLAMLNGRPDSNADRRARAFLAWALASGQQTARNMGYVALPAALAQQVRELLLTS